MPDPNLAISLLKPEEAEQYMRIRHEVFRTTVNNILYSRGEPSQKTLDRVTEDTRDGIINKGILFLKCVDTSTGEMIAGARWRYVKPNEEGAKERSWEEVDAGFVIPEPYDESDPELFKSLFNLFNSNKREILGTRPYYVLDTLVTLQAHERRGAGSMLVRWGCEKADEVGVEAFLEASPMGAPMYARHGFQPVKEVHLDLRQWGGKEQMTFIVSPCSSCNLLCNTSNILVAYVATCKAAMITREIHITPVPSLIPGFFVSRYTIILPPCWKVICGCSFKLFPMSV